MIVLLILMLMLSKPQTILASPILTEIHPNPTEGDEWVEICNDTLDNLDTSRIQIKDASGNVITTGNSELATKSYATFFSKNVLNNSGDTVYIYFDDYLVDTVTYPSLSKGESYTKCDDTWITTDVVSKGSKNTLACEKNDTIPIPITISEVYPYPNSDESEWVELINPSSELIAFEGFIDDIEDGSQPEAIEIIIPAGGLLTIEFAGNLFNNSGDSVRLLDKNQNVIDTLTYTESVQGMSFGRNDDQFEGCIMSPSKNSKNNLCFVSVKVPTPTITHSPLIQLSSSPTITIPEVKKNEESEKTITDFSLKHGRIIPTTPMPTPVKKQVLGESINETAEEDSYSATFKNPIIVSLLLFAINVIMIGSITMKPYISEFIDSLKKKKSV